MNKARRRNEIVNNMVKIILIAFQLEILSHEDYISESIFIFAQKKIILYKIVQKTYYLLLKLTLNWFCWVCMGVHDGGRGRVLPINNEVGGSVHICRREVDRRCVQLTVSENVRRSDVGRQERGVDNERRPDGLCDNGRVPRGNA